MNPGAKKREWLARVEFLETTEPNAVVELAARAHALIVDLLGKHADGESIAEAIFQKVPDIRNFTDDAGLDTLFGPSTHFSLGQWMSHRSAQQKS